MTWEDFVFDPQDASRSESSSDPAVKSTAVEGGVAHV
jgi:hypothetical protein